MRCSFQRASSGLPDGQARLTLRADLHLNPSRFASQQHVPNPLGDQDRVVLQKHGGGWTSVERALVPSDNFIAGYPRLVSRFRPVLWLDQVRRYVDSVYAVLDDTLHCGVDEMFDDPSEVHLVRDRPEFRVSECETYWEFFTNDPLNAVTRISNQLRGVGYPLSVRDRSLDPNSLEFESVGNSRRITVHNSAGSAVKIYAKTTHRIRIEHKADFRRRGTSWAPLDHFINRLSTIASIASNDVSDLFSTSCALNNFVGSHRSVVELVVALRESTNSLPEFNTVLQAIAANQQVCNPPNSSLGPTIRRLREKLVLCEPRQVGQVFIYAISPDYRRAAMQLGASTEELETNQPLRS